MKTRREVLLALGTGLLVAPSGALAQRTTNVWHVGVLASTRRPKDLAADDNYGALILGLSDLGYVEGKNLVIEWRFADGKYDRFPDLAAELVKLPVDVIVTDGSPPTIAAQKATSTLPIVFGSAGDPVGNGLVKDLAHPGGNTTGISLLTTETAPKQLEMLIRTLPMVSRVAVLWNPSNPFSLPYLKAFQVAAHTTKVQVVSVEIRKTEEIEGAFLLMVKERVGAFVLTGDQFLFDQRRLIAELAVKYRLPAIGRGQRFPEAGGLMSYGQSLPDNYRRAATYVDKILKGERPGRIPVEQPTKLDLVINKKTANELGVTIPPELLLLADRVIE